MRKPSKTLFPMIILLILIPNLQGSVSSSIDLSIYREEIVLKGKFYPATGTGSFPTVLLLQGFPGNEKDVLGLGKKMAAAGINALTFNYSGTHRSQGKFNFDNIQKDISAVYESINQPENIKKYKIDITRIILLGYSCGGGMALTYAASHPEIRRVISIAGNDHGAFME